MNAELWGRLKDWFGRAEGADPEERERLIREAEAESFELGSELRSLLQYDDASGRTASAAEATYADFEPATLEGQAGPYRLLREIGRGGSGIVFLAERSDDEFHRRVALKLLRLGAYDARREPGVTLERKALSQLQHPNIAALLDWGVTAEHIPWLAMEFVDGEPIDVYCRTRNLNLGERLELFGQACKAVQYAHRRLIVHRDLKPANILVSADVVVKLLDFGISKLLEDEVAGDTAERRFTPAYASPEQIQGGAATVATDVYGLGVLLYELISGALPFPEAPLSEVVRRIVEDEPKSPSEAAGLPAEERKLIRGDLDRIVLKALARDPEHRYVSAGALLADVKRYQNGYPVEARPAKLGYRVKKFVFRHRLPVAACAFALIALFAGTGIAFWKAAVAQREQRLAERRLSELQRLAHSVIFDLYDSLANVPGTVDSRRLLVSTALGYLDQLNASRIKDDRTQVELAEGYFKLANVQGAPFRANLGDSAGAVRNYVKTMAIVEEQWRRHPSDQHLPDVLFHSAAAIAENTPDPALGAKLLDDYIARADSWARSSASANAVSIAANIRQSRAVLLRASGQLAAAMQDLQEAAALFRQVAQKSPNCLDCVIDLSVNCNFQADLYRDMNRLQDAEAAYRISREFMQRAAALSTSTAQVQRQLAVIDRRESELLLDMGRLDEALNAARSGVARSAAARVADRADANALRDLAVADRRIGNVLCAQKNHSAGLERLQEAAEFLRLRAQQNPTFDWSFYEFAQGWNDYGACLLSATRTVQAREVFDSAMKAANAGLAQSPTNVQLYRERARAYLGLARSAETGSPAEARDFYLRSAANWRELRRRSPLDRRDLPQQQTAEQQSSATERPSTLTAKR